MTNLELQRMIEDLQRVREVVEQLSYGHDKATLKKIDQIISRWKILMDRKEITH